jgi:hypothetical protein
MTYEGDVEVGALLSRAARFQERPDEVRGKDVAIEDVQVDAEIAGTDGAELEFS